MGSKGTDSGRKIVRVFDYEKTTKNTHRFQERIAEGEVLVIGGLYCQQSAVGVEPPETLKVTIEVPA